MALLQRRPGPGLVHHSDRVVSTPAQHFRTRSMRQGWCAAGAGAATALTMPWSRASGRSRSSWCIAVGSLRRIKQDGRSSNTSRSGTIGSAVIGALAISAPPSSSNDTSERALRARTGDVYGSLTGCPLMPGKVSICPETSTRAPDRATLEMALGRRQPPAGLIHHWGRGVQYASAEYVLRLERAGGTAAHAPRATPMTMPRRRVSSKTLKREEVYLKDYQNYREAQENIGPFIEAVYNQKRLHSRLATGRLRSLRLLMSN